MWTSFIGFMASGKSTLTRRLRDTTNRPAVFLDEVIARNSGASIVDIFNSGGETAFRRAELAALRELDSARNLVLDTGGGIVHTGPAVSLLRKCGVVIWLDASWDVIRARLKADNRTPRPIVDLLGWAGLEELYRQRRSLYARAADFRLNSGSLGGEQVARISMLRSLIWERRWEGEPR